MDSENKEKILKLLDFLSHSQNSRATILKIVREKMFFGD
jgi:hypothetical protein